MPYALGIDEPVVIQSMGTKHSVKDWLDPSGKLRIDHQKADSSVVSGTVVSVPIPYSVNVDPVKWARGFSLFNPHCSFSVKIEEIEWVNDHANSEIIFNEIYQNTAVDKWNKFSTKDTASVHWYDLAAFRRLVYCYISDAQTGGTDILLRDFVMQFRGISSTVKAKAVCGYFAQRRLSEFDAHEEDIGRLLDVLKKSSQQPKQGILGIIGGDHFRDRFGELYGVKKFYYKKRLFIDAGIPYVMELAIAKTDPEYGCHAFYGINFSHSFGDPVQEYLRCGDNGMQIYSLAQLQRELGSDDVAMAFHLTSPALNFKDRGKTVLSVTEPVRKELQELIWECSRELYLEKKRRDRNERAALKADENSLKEATISFKEAVFKVLPDAMLKATGGLLPAGARAVFYQVRPLIQKYTEKELGYNYFSQTLLTDYRQTVGPLDLLYYDPRGVLYEPHTGIAVPLGTREVDSYEFPSWLYDKILYVEKKGFWPVLKAARLAEKYDMAVVVGEGYACEAVRVLFSNADKNQSYKIFVLHDADPDGYNICRTLAEETARMPGYKVDIHDMGLSIDYALSIGLPVETFVRKKALPSKLALSGIALERFTGTKVNRSEKMFKCERVELNAFTSVQIIEYIESKLIEFGITEKVIPDADSLPGMADAITKQMVHEMVERIISETFSIPKIAQDIHNKWTWDASVIKDKIEAKFNDDRSQSWRGAVHESFREHLSGCTASIRQEVTSQLVEQSSLFP
jgi:hypothetical protein